MPDGIAIYEGWVSRLQCCECAEVFDVEEDVATGDQVECESCGAELEVALGCLTGLLSFARVVSWLLKNYHDLAIALLSGFMIGSLNKVWPWKETLQTMIDRHGETIPVLQKSVLPGTYQNLGAEPHLLAAMAFMVLGVLLVVLLEKLAQYMNRSHNGKA